MVFLFHNKYQLLFLLKKRSKQSACTNREDCGLVTLWLLSITSLSFFFQKMDIFLEDIVWYDPLIPFVSIVGPYAASFVMAQCMLPQIDSCIPDYGLKWPSSKCACHVQYISKFRHNVPAR